MAMSSMSSMSMAMSSMSMAVYGMATTATGVSMPSSTGMSMATSTATSSGMGGMSMGGSGCKISMLWNWNTVDACFIARSWRITSKGMFAGSCVGVVLLVILLELLRRAGKEYDRFIVAQHAKSLAANVPTSSSSSDTGTSKIPTTSTAACTPTTAQTFRPSVLQQAIRALLHTCQFAVAYFVMLLAMYYNGYFIICIFIGAYLGFFIFGWEGFNVSKGGKDRMQADTTVCCG
ncbi:Ctr-domain-containing protein [Dothidotthia symphoricarpi CBS 119687]|uniref:Copper transport protein n=1 Tax=Dothidotthia symphoricarpi CBS 119687 TaxID=1392245 RepID=A0A6A6AVD5_9PLEO|nr:Ctr-domain-containing protein [Dothidotthia symphoricarpi CBS 119687]KAF2134817.1 Ctr-domain-containing protein [Dothidotthia symphoricarpi CBS 119687]